MNSPKKYLRALRRLQDKCVLQNLTNSFGQFTIRSENENAAGLQHEIETSQIDRINQNELHVASELLNDTSREKSEWENKLNALYEEREGRIGKNRDHLENLTIKRKIDSILEERKQWKLDMPKKKKFVEVEEKSSYPQDINMEQGMECLENNFNSNHNIN